MGKVGKPTTYTSDIGYKICELIATSSKSMAKICEQIGISYFTHLTWLRNNNEYKQLYAQAKEDQADFLAEEIIEIADDSSGDYMEIDVDGVIVNKVNNEHIQRSRLRVDARKFVASKLKPKKYGDKIDLTTGNLPMPDIKIVIPNIEGE